MSKWAYVSGLLDADGCIGLFAHKKYVTLSISISGQSRELMVWLIENCGGSFCFSNNTYMWRFSGNHREFLNAVRPFMITKKNQVNLAIEYLDWTDINSVNERHSDRDRIMREEFKTRSKKVNKIVSKEFYEAKKMRASKK